MKQTKHSMRMRRAKKTRAKLNLNGTPRITITRSNKNIRAQLIVVDNKQHKVVVSASSLENAIDHSSNKTNVSQQVGKLLAERAIKAGIEQVAFDRSGYKYHGRIKALADAAREAGMKF